MFDLTRLEWTLSILAALFVGLAKTAINGIGLLTVVTMAMVFPAKESTGIVLPMLIFGDAFAVLIYRRQGDAKILLRLLPFAAAGVVFGFLFMGRVDNAQLRRVLGGVVLAMIALGVTLKLKKGVFNVRGLPFAAASGVFAGFTTMIANAAGPVMTVYLEAMEAKKDKFVGNMAWFFAFMNLFKLPFSARLGLVTPESLKFNLILFPAVLIGATGGYFLLKAIPQKAFDIGVQSLAAVSALHLIFG